jgi:hypothetical protein
MASREIPFVDVTDIDPDAVVDLVVGWRSGQATHLRRLRMSTEVADTFRAMIREWLADLANREQEAWAPDADVSAETALVIGLDELGPQPPLTREHRDQDFLTGIRNASDLPILTPDALPATPLSLYALVVGDDPQTRTVFLRRMNPQRSLRRGRLLTSLHDVLVTVDGPMFGFDSLVDLVVGNSTMVVLSQTTFAALFRGNDALAAQVPAWVADIHAHVPMTDEGAATLGRRALRDSRIRGRLEAIARRGHLANVTTQQLRECMTQHGLDADALLDAEGNLVLDDADVTLVVQFLNEDLFVGTLSSTAFRADRKHARGN